MLSRLMLSVQGQEDGNLQFMLLDMSQHAFSCHCFLACQGGNPSLMFTHVEP